MTDDRYIESGYITNEYDMMKANGIFKMLEDLPSFQRYTEPTAFTENEFRSWNRGTLSWKLECETGGNDATRE